MPEKVRSKEDLKIMKGIIRDMWVFQGYSIRKLCTEFNANKEYVDKYGTVSLSSVAVYVREARRELENCIDEDFLEKYTAEFVRRRFIMEEQIEKLREAQNFIDFKTGDSKDKDLYLKFEMAIHNIGMDQMRMMTDIELVLNIKKLNKEKRLRDETLVLIPDKTIANNRGYILNDIKDNTLVNETDSILVDVKEDKNITVQDVEDVYNADN